MSNEDTNQPADDSQDEGGKVEPSPPWSSDEEFKPDLAWKRITSQSRDIERLRKELAETQPAVQRVKELEDASKTETQKLAEAAETHKGRADKAEAQLMRLTVGLEKGLTPAQAKRLVGSTKEELEADADELLTSFGGSKSSGSDRPRENLRGGGDPTEEPEPDIRKIADQIPRR